MTPSLFARYADRLFSHRWWLLGASIAGVGVVIALISISSPSLTRAAGAIVGPIILVPWGLLCMCVWFHPQHGNLQPASRFVGRLPQSLQSTVRWYAAIFLAVFLVIGAIVWPFMALTWLNNA